MSINSDFHTKTTVNTPSRRLYTRVSAAVFKLESLLILLLETEVLGFYSKSFW
jgi:hypothetical protein